MIDGRASDALILATADTHPDVETVGGGDIRWDPHLSLAGREVLRLTGWSRAAARLSANV
jgi:hypothetical protein